ncbi:MAG: hypothetical protein JSS81_05355 [Acidobacteria bacterium]|nr:hypothetical protein [Acidobacteriota bacterium]
MSEKTITKFFVFVICFSFVCLFFSGCSAVFPTGSRGKNRTYENSPYEKPRVLGRLESKEIDESSGLAASKCQPDVFWTHNDSGDDAFIFALGPKGENLGTWKVAGAKNTDWEDIAEIKTPTGECVLYIGDIGNNRRDREELVIYRVGEPRVSPESKNSSRKNPLETEPAAAIRIAYPDQRHDAEALMVHPATGDIYILSKQKSDPAAVYRLKSGYDPNGVNRLEKLTDFTVPAVPYGFLTGGDIAPDGKHVIICDYFDAYELTLPDGAKNFDEIWKQPPVTVELGPREVGEAVAYAADGKAIYATSENKNPPFIEVKRK